MRVLVVEDEQHGAALFLDTLSRLGHMARAVHTADDAFAALARERPDAIIVDLDLLGADCLDFLGAPAIRESGVPVLAVAHVLSDEQIRECLRLGAFDFMPKPVSLDRLREILMFLQDHTANTRARLEGGQRDRRRAARAPVEVPVRVAEDDGTEWEGRSVDISPFGIKVRSQHTGTSGPVVTLSFGLPDDGPTIRTRALVVRQHETYAYYFVNLSDETFRRLTVLVQRLLVS
jgi:DNA-binding response OmpR family regulator